MKADLCAQAEQVEMELIASYLGNPKDLERMGLVQSKSVQQGEPGNEIKPTSKSFNGSATSDSHEIRYEDAERERQQWFDDSIRRIYASLETNYGVKIPEYQRIVDVAMSYGDDGSFRWIEGSGILDIAPHVWDTSKRFAKGNIKGHFLISLENLIRNISEHCQRRGSLRYVQLDEWIRAYGTCKKVSA